MILILLFLFMDEERNLREFGEIRFGEFVILSNHTAVKR